MKRIFLVLTMIVFVVMLTYSAFAQEQIFMPIEEGPGDQIISGGVPGGNVGNFSSGQACWYYYQDSNLEPWWEYWCYWPGWGWEYVFWVWA